MHMLLLVLLLQYARNAMGESMGVYTADYTLVEKPSLVGRPKSTIVSVPLKTGTKDDL